MKVLLKLRGREIAFYGITTKKLLIRFMPTRRIEKMNRSWNTYMEFGKCLLCQLPNWEFVNFIGKLCQLPSWKASNMARFQIAKFYQQSKHFPP